MTGAERAIFNHLPDAESRREFIKDFWDKRDPDPETEANEFKEEFQNRIDYANKHFIEGRRGVNTDRGRIYMYLGQPDKIEEFPFVQTEEIRGPVLWWLYYEFGLGIEFIDARGTGAFTINEISGNLFEAIERAKLGAVYDKVSGAAFLDFQAEYDRGKREFVLTIPVKRLNFKEEAGVLKAEFEFEFYIYRQGEVEKEIFSEPRLFEGKQEDLEKSKEIVFVFPRALAPGKYFIDIIISGKAGNGKSRKIFEITV